MADAIKFPSECVNDINDVGVIFQKLSLSNGHDLVLSQLADRSLPTSNSESQLYESMRDPAVAREIIERIEPLMDRDNPELFYIISLTDAPVEKSTGIETLGLISLLHTSERSVRQSEAAHALGGLCVNNERRLSAWIPADGSWGRTLASEVAFDLVIDLADARGIDKLTIVRNSVLPETAPVMAEDMLSAFTLNELGFEKVDPIDSVAALSGQETFVRISHKTPS